MPETPPFYVWPMADRPTLVLIMLLVVGLFAIAVFAELFRRRRDRTFRLQAEWRAVRELCQDRELHDEDIRLLLAIVTQYAPDSPYKAVTKRTLFDECMARYFKALRSTATEEEVARRGEQLREVRAHLGLDYVPLGQRIHSTRELHVGLSVWAARASGREPRWYHFRVAHVDEAAFQLEAVGTDATPEFTPGDTLKFRLLREEDARYVFDAPLHRIDVKHRHWCVEHVESMTRNQARAHFRVRFDETVMATVLNAALNEDYAGLEQRPAVTQVRGHVTSLSGGGLAAVFQQPLPIQVLLRIPITLPDHDSHLITYVRPVSAQHMPGGRSLLRGRFVAMDEETRELIARHVFLKQKQNAGEDRV